MNDALTSTERFSPENLTEPKERDVVHITHIAFHILKFIYSQIFLDYHTCHAHNNFSSVTLSPNPTVFSLVFNTNFCNSQHSLDPSRSVRNLGLRPRPVDSSEIPIEWPLAYICPLFKKADRYLACNYRPISLTCVPCKLLEHIVF